MNAEESLFHEFLSTLDEGRLRRVMPAVGDWWSFIGDGGFSRYYRELGYIDWLERRGDCRGEFLRLLATLPARSEWAAGATPFDPIEDEFLREIIDRPGDVTPRRVYADWLEERGDPRADLLRRLARLQELAEGINPEWTEVLELTPVPSPPGMSYARWTERGRRVMHLANQEAILFNHCYLGTQHILLALLGAEFGLAAAGLTRRGLDLPAAFRQVERLAPICPEETVTGELPQSARARSALCHAWEDAEEGGRPAAPEHLLLGVCRAGPCVGTRLLRSLGISPAAVAAELVVGMGGDARRWVRDHPEVW